VENKMEEILGRDKNYGGDISNTKTRRRKKSIELRR
jgi:hypothetical protein